MDAPSTQSRLTAAPAGRPFRVRITVVVSLILAAVAMATAGLTIGALIHLSRFFALQNWSNDSRHVARIAGATIGSNESRAISKPSDFGSKEYRHLQSKLQLLEQAIEPVEFAYLVRLKKDESSPDGLRIYWLMGHDPAKEQPFLIGQEYVRVGHDNEILRWVFKNRRPSADRTFHLDEDYGYFMSGYAPVYVDTTTGDMDVVVIDHSLTSFIKQRHVVVGAILITGVTVSLLMVILGAFLGHWMCGPLRSISERLEQLSSLKLEAQGKPVRGTWALEIDHLVDSVNRLAAAMQSFALYLPGDVIKTLLDRNEMASRSGEKLEIAILFSDIRNFTAYTEKTDVDLMIIQLNDYLTRVSAGIASREGTIDKFIGDGIMAFWGAPTPVAQPAYQACATALAIRRITAEMNEELRAAGMDLDFFTRIGLHFGTAVVGNLGSDARISYTAIGDAVNLASRLESANKEHGTDILVSRQIVDAVVAERGEQPFRFSRIGDIAIRGKSQQVEVFCLEGPCQHNESTASSDAPDRVGPPPPIPTGHIP